MSKKELKKERRERYLEKLIEESVINVLAEQEPQQSAVPPSPVPPAPETNIPEPPPVEEEPTEEFTVDHMVDKLNVIRGGRSFADPEVYGRIVTYFNSLPDEEKNAIDKFLTDLGSVIIDATEEEIEQAPPQQQGQTQQPPPQRQQQAPAAAAAPSMPITPSNIR